MAFWVHELMAAAIGLFAGLASGLTLYIIKVNRLRQKSRLQLIDSFHKEIRLILWEAVRETQASNAVLIHMHNGGPSIAAGMRQYSSVVDEAPQNPAFASMNDWQSVPVDGNYREFLIGLKQQGAARLLTEEMPNGVLRRRYEAMGVTASIVFWCYETDGGPYHVSFPTDSTNPLGYLGGVDYNRLEAFTNRIRNVLRKYKKLEILH